MVEVTVFCIFLYDTVSLERPNICVVIAFVLMTVVGISRYLV